MVGGCLDADERTRQSGTMFRPLLTLITVALLGGCATMPSLPPGTDGELITYQTSPGPFCGRCTSTKLVVASNGVAWLQIGHWAGAYTDWQTTERRWKPTAEQLAAFRFQLARIRPKGVRMLTEEPACKSVTQDMEEFDVHWRGNGPDARLMFDIGCDTPGGGEIWKTLGTAPSLLGLKDLPGVSRPNLLER
jgi:hypothetical protein